MNQSFRTLLNRGLLLNIALSTGISMVLVSVLARFVPQASVPYGLIVGCALITLIIGLIHQSIKRGRMLAPNTIHYLVPELFTMVVIMRIAALIDQQARMNELMLQWLQNPLSFIEPRFILYLLLALIIAVISHAHLSDLRTLEPYQLSKEDYREDTAHQFAVIVSSEQKDAFTRISSRLVYGFIVLLVLLALERVDITQLDTYPILPIGAIGMLVYLLAALLFYSQARLALLQASWVLEGVALAPNLVRYWLILCAALLSFVLSIAWLLPRSYGGPLFNAASWLFGWVTSALLFIAGGLFWVIGWLISLPLALIPEPSGNNLPSEPPLGLPPALPPAVVEASAPRSIWPAVIFWFCIALLVGYALMLLLRRYPGWRKLFSRGPFAWLFQQWTQISKATQSWVNLAQERFSERFAPSELQHTKQTRLRLRSLSPRNLLRYFYYSVLRRAEQSGVPRQPAQTPAEYAQSFSAVQSELAPEFSELSEAFIKAQYSKDPISSQDTYKVEGLWKQLIRALRKRN